MGDYSDKLKLLQTSHNIITQSITRRDFQLASSNASVDGEANGGEEH
jgi:hypothetical protein